MSIQERLNDKKGRSLVVVAVSALIVLFCYVAFGKNLDQEEVQEDVKKVFVSDNRVVDVNTGEEVYFNPRI